MIALLGGKYNGKYLNRPKDHYAVGDRFAVITATGKVEAVYIVRPGGIAEIDDPNEHFCWGVPPSEVV